MSRVYGNYFEVFTASENYLELLRRGYKVYVGRIGAVEVGLVAVGELELNITRLLMP